MVSISVHARGISSHSKDVFIDQADAFKKTKPSGEHIVVLETMSWRMKGQEET